MKPFLTKEERERREKKRIQAIGIVMLIIMVLSTFGYAIVFYSGSRNSQNSENRSNELNNIEESFLAYSKNETKNIPVSVEKKLSDYYGKRIYVAGANEEENREISKALYGKIYSIQPACYGPCKQDLPEKNCSEAMFVLRNGSSEKVYQQEECIFVEGGLKALDAFLYYLIS